MTYEERLVDTIEAIESRMAEIARSYWFWKDMQDSYVDELVKIENIVFFCNNGYFPDETAD